MNLTFKKAGKIPAGRQRGEQLLARFQNGSDHNKQIGIGKLEKIAQREAAGGLARIFSNDQFRAAAEAVTQEVGKSQKLFGVEADADFSAFPQYAIDTHAPTE